MSPNSSKKVVYAALAGNFAIAVTKFCAAAFTGSAAMFSEAVHSLVDTGNQVLLLFGMNRSSRPPSREHPFGYGLQLYFWSFVVAILVFTAGASVSIWEGVERVRDPGELHSPWVNLSVLVVAAFFEAGAWFMALKAFRASNVGVGTFRAVRNSKDSVVLTVLFEDSAALLGLLVAFVGILLAHALDMPVLDGVASIVIGVLLAATACFLAYESYGLLTGESVSAAAEKGIRAIVVSEPGVERVNELLTMHFGPSDALVALSLDFADHLPTGVFEETVSRIEARIKAAHPEITRVFVEAQSFEAHRRSLLAYGGAHV